MHSDKIVQYHPSSKLPQLTYLTERLPSKNLNFSKSLLSFRKKQAQIRVTNMLNFLDSTGCRAQFLLKYFDEKLENICGKCDICLGSKNEEMSPIEFEKLKSQITKIIKSGNIRLSDLNYYFPFNKKARVLKTIQFLENESYLKLDKGKLILTKANNL